MLRLLQQSAVAVCLAIVGMAMPAALSAQAAPQAATPQATSPKATAASGQAHHAAKRKKKQDPEPEVVQPPPPPPTPEQLPPVAPTVSYQGGQLSIQSQNATLAQVLRAVQNKIGASFDIPASANNDRVVAQLGPGRPSDVLNSLLNGSKFDYIILGLPNQPGTVQKLILTTRSNAPANNTTTQARATTPPQEESQAEEDYSQPEPPPPAEENSAENQNQVPPGGYRPGIPGGPQNPEFPGQQAGSPDAQPGQGVKTPEQLLQELQRMQQQQQQYQQQLNPANRNLPPPNNLPQEQQ